MHGARHEVIPDRIEAGTYMLMARQFRRRRAWWRTASPNTSPPCREAAEAGQEVEERPGCRAGPGAGGPSCAADVETQVHPGFPTDLQSPWVCLMGLSDGIAVVQETIFENRFGFVNELIRLGANIKVDRNTAIVRGVERLTGAPVEAKDIRGGAALVARPWRRMALPRSAACSTSTGATPSWRRSWRPWVPTSAG